MTTYTYKIVSNYGRGYETTCLCDDIKEALRNLKEYQENEPQYSHKIAVVIK